MTSGYYSGQCRTFPSSQKVLLDRTDDKEHCKYELCACSVTQSCLTLGDPTDCSPPGSSGHGDSPGKNTAVGCLPSSRGSSQLRDQTQVSCIVDRFFTTEPPGKPKNMGVDSLSLLQGIFPTQKSNQSPALQANFLPVELPGKPMGWETEEERMIVSLGCINIL